MNTNDKGDIAVTQIIADLSLKGYTVFFPISEHCKVDIIAYKNNLCYRLQVKHSLNGLIRTGTVCNGVHKVYNIDDFDFYALYLSEINKIVYVPIELSGKKIQWDRSALPNNNQDVIWYEDFLDISPNIVIKKVADLKKLAQIPRAIKTKKPPKEELEQEFKTKTAVEIAKIYRVTDRTIGKWARSYNIPTHPRGKFKQQN